MPSWSCCIPKCLKIISQALTNPEIGLNNVGLENAFGIHLVAFRYWSIKGSHGLETYSFFKSEAELFSEVASMSEENHKIWQESLKQLPEFLLCEGEQQQLLVGKHLAPLTPRAPRQLHQIYSWVCKTRLRVDFCWQNPYNIFRSNGFF